MQNLYKDLIQELSKNEKFLLEGQVSASKVRDKAYKLDPDLIGLLFGNERLKQEFFDTPQNSTNFDPLKGVKELPLIFNYPKFAKFITNKEFLPDSYTEFESNIGLSVGDKFLNENKEVVLSFPFKDCILEGGMDTEEVKNRKEIFYNQTLAPDDIHKLKSPKALKNWKRYTANGEIILTNTDFLSNFNSPEENPQNSTNFDPLKTPNFLAKVDPLKENPQNSTNFDPLKGVRAIYQDKFSGTGFTFPANKDLKDRAKEMSKNMTKAEQLVWFNILESEKTGFKWIKQKVIDNYIVDFYCHTLGLVIEIDGDTHAEKKEYDEVRSKFLNNFSLEVVRFSNDDVYKNLSEVDKKLKEIIARRQQSLLPLSRGQLSQESWGFSRGQNPQDFGGLKLNPDGTFDENFIIKGNNLLALYSLIPRYRGKIKLIYIDPPYNTGNDGFKYNDDFNHSTWLVFMKNRLEVARELLRDDGVIFVQCDDNEQAYLKVLMDEVFGRENFVQTGVVNRASEIATSHTIQKHEYFLIFAKKIQQFKVDSIEKYTISRGTVGNKDQTMPIITFPKGLKCINIKDGIYKETRKINESLENIENLDPIIVKNGVLDQDVRLKARWRSSNDMRKFFENNCMPTQAKINGIIEEIYFENDRFNPQIKKRTFEKIPSLILENKRGSKDLEEIGMKNVFDFPKSEFFIQKLIEISTQPNDIVLDYHLGSGTTCAVAHKMDRRYIGVEQMDYIETIAVERLKKVIGRSVEETTVSLFDGTQNTPSNSTNLPPLKRGISQEENFEDFDTGGISKAVNWQGGGDFIYLELAKNNITYLEKIEGLENGVQAWSLFEELADSIWISYRVDIDKFKEHKDQFLTLELDDQKKVLRDIINYNHLYVNYEDMEDIAYKDCGLSDEDKALTTQFYEKKQADQNEIL